MKPTLKQKAILSLFGILIATALFFSPVTKIPLLDTKTDTYFNDAITKAGLAYATCRAINASVSVVKDSTLQLEPAGVGVSLAVGQILDPIDDMTERLSSVLVTAITSLGVQKLSYEIGVTLAPQVFAVFLIILSILVWFNNDRIASLHKITTRILILIAVLRFCLPVSSIANDYIYKNYFSEQIIATNQELTVSSRIFDQFGDIVVPEATGFWGTIENSTSFIKKVSVDFKNALKASVTDMKEIIENLLKLTFLYVGIFIIQVIILPLLIFWFFIKIANTLFQTNNPVIFKTVGPMNEK
ncbi:MAG: hypothetical protein KJ630_05615 [Proteobacteria bacterium]|nr:hypothetical protein [Pseudomonadota bacterium]